jgi:hypothetical protein
MCSLAKKFLQMCGCVLAGGSAAFGAQLLGIEAGKVNRRTGEQAKEADKNDSVLDLLKYDVPRCVAECQTPCW